MTSVARNESELTDLLCDEETMEITVRGEFTFTVKKQGYIDAFEEAIRSIDVNHPGYRYASFT